MDGPYYKNTFIDLATFRTFERFKTVDYTTTVKGNQAKGSDVVQPSPVLPTTFPAVQTEFCIFIKENDDWKLLHRDHLYNTSAKGVGRWVQKTAIFADGQYQRSYTRWLYKRIYKTEMKFWAVLGSRGCREKKPPNCHKYATF